MVKLAEDSRGKGFFLFLIPRFFDEESISLRINGVDSLWLTLRAFSSIDPLFLKK